MAMTSETPAKKKSMFGGLFSRGDQETTSTTRTSQTELGKKKSVLRFSLPPNIRDNFNLATPLPSKKSERRLKVNDDHLHYGGFDMGIDPQQHLQDLAAVPDSILMNLDLNKVDSDFKSLEIAENEPVTPATPEMDTNRKQISNVDAESMRTQASTSTAEAFSTKGTFTSESEGYKRKGTAISDLSGNSFMTGGVNSDAKSRLDSLYVKEGTDDAPPVPPKPLISSSSLVSPVNRNASTGRFSSARKQFPSTPVI